MVSTVHRQCAHGRPALPATPDEASSRRACRQPRWALEPITAHDAPANAGTAREGGFRLRRPDGLHVPPRPGAFVSSPRGLQGRRLATGPLCTCKFQKHSPREYSSGSMCVPQGGSPAIIHPRYGTCVRTWQRAYGIPSFERVQYRRRRLNGRPSRSAGTV